MSFWDDRRKEIAYLLDTQPVENMLASTPIQWTMNTGNAEWIAHELKHLMSSLRWRKIFETYVEHPWAAPLEKYPGTHLLGNTIHHMYHWMFFEEYTSKKLSDINSIFEFGGGFGSMSRIARFAGFTGTYRILDFPELHRLASQYYDDAGIIRLGNVSELGAEPYDLLVAMWSVTESNAILRNKVMRSSFTRAIIAYSSSFGDLRNTAYFEGVAQHYGGINLKIPWINDNYYYIKNDKSSMFRP